MVSMKRKHYEEALKARVALEAVKGEKTVVSMEFILTRLGNGRNIY